MNTNDPTLASAAAHHDAGRLIEAEQAYRQLLADRPDDSEAITRLGDVLADAGRPEEAAQCYRRAIDMTPNEPASAAAYDGLAAVLQDQGKLSEAAAASLRAVELRRDGDAAYGLGDTLQRLGRSADAIAAFRLAARLRPKFAEPHARLGALHLAADQTEEAIASYEVAIALKPELAEAHCNLANALRRGDDLDRALLSAKRALELKPDLAEAHNVLGAIWKERRRPSDALKEFVRAAQLRPDYAEATNNAGSVLEQLGRSDEATFYFDKAVSLRPVEPVFHVNLAHNLLLRGDYARGWVENEWRRHDRSNPASRSFDQAQWMGEEDMSGQTVLLHAEQGIGDTILFARYIPLVAARGARVIVESQPSIAPVLRWIEGASDVLPQGQKLPAFDRHSPLLTLPLLFRTTSETVPRHVPYITPDAQRLTAWAAKMPPADGARLRVGLVWAGNPRHKNDRARSCPPALLNPLGSVEGVAFFSLQKDADSAALPALRLIDLTQGLGDFADTAALIAHLDLVIAVDTAVAHLAGAMGKPTWLMVPSLPDWRWGVEGETSRWYPTLRLFRQGVEGDWSSVVARVTAALTSLAGA